jgi:carbonic anhydrase
VSTDLYRIRGDKVGAWRIVYGHRDCGYVLAASEEEALRAVKRAAPKHWDRSKIRIVPDARHAARARTRSSRRVVRRVVVVAVGELVEVTRRRTRHG